MIELFSQTPIKHEYPAVTEDRLRQISAQDSLCEIQSHENIRVINAYYRDNLPGTLSLAFSRQAVSERIKQVAEFLKPKAGLFIFDVFRTIETQTFLYNSFREKIKKDHPELNDQQLELKTCEFVSHPTDKNHWEIPLHNSGGAIDLEIYDLNTHQAWDFGTAIDEISELSHTSFFEKSYEPKFKISESRWLTIRNNRRILFNAMKYVGFTNFSNEWWHYDVGDCSWAKILNTHWVFDSMESMVKDIYPTIL